MIKMHGVILLTVILFSLTFSDQKPFTLSDCFKMAIKHSDTLSEQQDNVKQAQENYEQTMDTMLPTIYGSYAYLRQNPDSVGEALADNTTAKLTGTVPIFRGQKIINAAKQMESLSLAQQKIYRWGICQLYTDVSSVFYSLISTQKAKTLLLKQEKLYNARLAELNQRLQIGRSQKTEVLSFQASLASLQAQIIQIEDQLSSIRGQLSFLLGQSSSSIEVTETQDTPQLDSLDSYYLHIYGRPDIAAISLNVTAAQANLDIAKETLWWPIADLSADSYLQHPSTYTNMGWDATLQITFPDFITNAQDSKIRQAVDMLHQAQTQLFDAKRQARLDIETVYNTLHSELLQIQQLEKAVMLSEQNVTALVADYRLGLCTNLDVLQAMNNAISMGLSLNTTRYAFKSNFAKLQSLIAHVPE